MNDPNVGIEIELGKGKRKFYIKVFFDPFAIWIDFQGLPEIAFLCACHEGTPIMNAKLVKEDEERLFVNIEWCIDFWRSDKKMLTALKKRKKMIMDEMPVYKELIAQSNQEKETAEDII